MKIILAPAKKMVSDDSLSYSDIPVFIDEANELLNYLKKQSFEELKRIYKASDSIVLENMERIREVDLSKSLSPAILSYDGIAFKHMAPNVFTDKEFNYVQKHLRILSGLYGVLKPFDGIRPYRLEMGSTISYLDYRDLYSYWNNRLYEEILDDDHLIINLASKEYSKIIEDFIKEEDRFITITFKELVKGKYVSKATYAKMARGEMVRFMAENEVEDLDKLKEFNNLGFKYSDDLSSDNEFVFIKEGDE
ncbi:MAG: peroxide stress protein YaaA [Erysipelotrichaceae bacterium]|nr:peroxide stress protein YaaA [Erysipelotrichaceae bacterium]